MEAILLVDPPIGKSVKSLKQPGIRLETDHHSKDPAYTRRHSLAPDFNPISILPSDTSDDTQPRKYPQYYSMFDDILSVTSTTPSDAVGPRSCTEPACRLVISIFLTYLRRRILNMLRLQDQPCKAVSSSNRCDYLRDFSTGVMSNWQHELFGFVVNVKYIMGIIIQETNDNIVALGLTRPGVQVPQWEKDGWLAIQEHCGMIMAMAEAFLQSYLQFITMQNASSLARITYLTMSFIPLSAIAAIFSNDG